MLRGRTMAWVTISSWVVAIAALGALTQAAEAASAITVSVTPGTVSMAAGDSVTATVVVENTSRAPASGLDIDERVNAGVDVVEETGIDSTIAPGGSALASYTITAREDRRIGGSVDFVVTAIHPDEGGGSDTPAVAIASLPVEGRGPAATERPIAVEILTALSKLTDLHTPRLYVQVENVSTETIRITEVRGVVPPFLAISAPEASLCATPTSICSRELQPSEQSLDPHEQQLFEFAIGRKQERPFQSGNQVMVFRVEVLHSVDGKDRLDCEARLRNASFFLLPGFLFVVVLSGIHDSSGPRDEATTEPADKTDV